MSVEINTKASTLAEELTAQLERLEERSEQYEAAALAGTLSPSTVAQIDGEKKYAKMRADAANRAASEEQSKIAPEKELRAAVKEFTRDPNLSIDPLLTALEAVEAALSEFDTAVAARNQSVVEWVKKLRTLGVPNSGMTIDDNPIELQGGGVIQSGTSGREIGSISIGGATVSVVNDVAPFISSAVWAWLPDTQIMRLDKESLSRYDRRDKIGEPVIWATVTRAVGSLKPRTRVNNNQLTIGSLELLVSGGYATWDDESMREVDAPGYVESSQTAAEDYSHFRAATKVAAV
jgi:hypothetical protein